MNNCITKKDYIDKLKNAKGFISDCSLYSELVKCGFMTITLNFWHEIYDYYNIRLVVNSEFKNTKERSYEETAEKFGVCEMTIKRAVDKMRESIDIK